LLTAARGGIPALLRILSSRPGALAFLAVPDRVVTPFASEISQAGPGLPATIAFVHLSGALDLGALAPLAERHPVGSFHPLQSFPYPHPPSSFRGIVVAVDAGSEQLLKRLRRLARLLGARPRRVDDSQRVAYHAAAVFASNYVVTLLNVAVRMLQQIGWTEREAALALRPLAQEVVADVARRGPTAALTGPVRRGDVNTVNRHLQALAGLPAGEPAGSARRADLYRMLGTIALEIAKEAGLEPVAAEQMSKALTRKMAATRRRGRK
jgi:predicted short-subunit dehydrogenase-like oxidoreductase (DUF2520 family)